MARNTPSGFFLRDMGYYFTLGDYADLPRGGFYTLVRGRHRPHRAKIKTLQVQRQFLTWYLNIKTGEKRRTDYIKQSNFPHPVT